MILRRSSWFLVLLSVIAFALPAPGAENSPTDGALSGSVWYDAATDETIPIEVRDETKDSVNRDSRWLPKPDRVRRTTPSTPAAGGTAGAAGLFGTGLTLPLLMAWTLGIIVIASLIAVFVYAVSTANFDNANGSRARRRDGNEAMMDEQRRSRIKHLPAELRRTDVNMRDEAERLMNAGEFDQAIILLFGHQLLLLDQSGYLRLNRSKTNGRYVRETRASDRTSADRLRETVDTFERSYFGRHEISSDEFSRLWESNERLETHLAAAEGVAA